MSAKTGVTLSERARKVARWFGVEGQCERDELKNATASTPEVDLAPGTITLITGASGAGKSSLLRKLRRTRKHTWIDVARIRLPQAMVVDCFDSDQLEDVLMMLGRVGLGEVWTYLRTPAQLSEGQRWRLRWAMALWEARKRASQNRPVVISCDEFCALLDPVTARVVSRCLRRMIGQIPGVCAVVASSRDDLVRALEPEVVITCDFGACTVEHVADNPRTAVTGSLGKGFHSRGRET